MEDGRGSPLPPRADGLRGEKIRTPDEPAPMVRLRALGWGSRRIAAELGRSRSTVKRYLASGSWAGYRMALRPGRLAGIEGWLAERFRQRRGNANVVRTWLVGLG
jgi:hypothetical protein